jgi:radical SAM superfamily enzyme YgiQ (UPF0313 family)
VRVLFLEIDTEGSWAVASIGPAFLGAFLRRAGHECALQRVAWDESAESISKKVRAYGPDLLALSLTTRQWLRGRAVVGELRRELDVPVIAGGLHPTFAPEEVLASPGFDYVCLGEGEEPLAELCALLEETRGFSPRLATARLVKNIQVRGAPRPELRKPFEPLDALPFMARDLLDERWGVVHMTTQRGCPFPCTYCAARKYEDLYEGTGDYGRRRSHESVLAELEEIRRNGLLSYVIFLDDTFTIQHPWVKQFCKLFGERFAIPFSLHARVETVNPEMLELLAKAGCKHITYGVESGSLRVRREIMHRPVVNERFKEVFRWTRANGILATANYMLGLPGETKDDVEQTLALHEELEPDDFGYFVFYPYPGTELFKICKEKGYLPENYLELPANHRASILRLPDLTQEDIGRFYDRFTAARERAYLKKYGSEVSDENRASIACHVSGAAAKG